MEVVQAVNSGYLSPDNRASMSVTFGAIPADGETILLICALDSGNPWENLPPGFLLEETDTYDGLISVWSRVASSEVSATYSITGANTWRHGELFGVRLSGGDATTVMEAETKSTGYSATQTAPSVTTLTDEAWHLAIWKLKDSIDATAEAAPFGYTKIDGLRNCLYAYKPIPIAGDSGSADVTLTPANGWVSLSFSVKPGIGGGPSAGIFSVSGGGTLSVPSGTLQIMTNTGLELI